MPTRVMADSPMNPPSGDMSKSPPSSGRGSPVPLNTIAICLIIAAASWFLLDVLAGVLRPLLLALLLGNVLLPWHYYLRRWLPGPASVAVLAVAAAGLLFLLALALHSSALELNEELPYLTGRARSIGEQARQFWTARAPSWLGSDRVPGIAVRTDWTAQLRTVLGSLINGAAGALTEGLVVGFYLLFVLLESGRFSERVRRAFPDARAEEILGVLARINVATATYLRVKVKASLVLALPVTVILSLFGVKFALMWGLLTFVANFIPYVGSVVSCSLPILFAFLQLDPGWQPLAVAVLLLTDHVLSASVIEPAMTGRAVGLSPLVVLIALAVWGQCWGLIGMVLAVPLTVVLKIILENFSFTRPLARLMVEDEVPTRRVSDATPAPSTPRGWTSS